MSTYPQCIVPKRLTTWKGEKERVFAEKEESSAEGSVKGREVESKIFYVQQTYRRMQFTRQGIHAQLTENKSTTGKAKKKKVFSLVSAPIKT